MYNTIILSEYEECVLDEVFTWQQKERISNYVSLCPEYVKKADIERQPDAYKDIEYIFSCWGMPVMNTDEIEQYFPKLKMIFYCSGSVQYFARPFLEKGVRIFSAWAANAVPVAEFTVGQIIMANKGVLRAVAMRRGNVSKHKDVFNYCENFCGNYNINVGIIGAGMIGRKVIQLLQAFSMKCYVYDPYLPSETAAALGVEKIELEDLFKTCHVVSNHLPNNEKTKQMLRGNHFRSMLPYASFINTGRGAQVAEDEMISVLQSRTDLTAYLDVTYPEPPEENSLLYTLDNVFLTPHLAGSMHNEYPRMTEYMLDEMDNCFNGGECKWEITQDMLETLA